MATRTATDPLQMDAAVARALGWEVRDEFYPSDGEYAGQLVYDLTGECRGGPGQGWSPSTRIEQAMEVVEEMERRWWWFRLETYPNPYGINDGATVVAAFKPTGMPGHPADEVTAAAEDAPLAICGAALNAIAVST